MVLRMKMERFVVITKEAQYLSSYSIQYDIRKSLKYFWTQNLDLTCPVIPQLRLHCYPK